MKPSTIEINMEVLTEAGKLLLLGISAKLKCSPQEAVSSAVNSSGHLLFNRDRLITANKIPQPRKDKHSETKNPTVWTKENGKIGNILLNSSAKIVNLDLLER